MLENKGVIMTIEEIVQLIEDVCIENTTQIDRMTIDKNRYNAAYNMYHRDLTRKVEVAYEIIKDWSKDQLVLFINENIKPVVQLKEEILMFHKWIPVEQ